jgi:hypothetical protein
MKIGAEVFVRGLRTVKGKTFTQGSADLVLFTRGNVAAIIEVKCEMTNPAEDAKHGLLQVQIQSLFDNIIFQWKPILRQKATNSSSIPSK